MYYYLYEIRNNINGKIYVGVHKTKVLDDGYMGSGKVIRSAIKKHGSENFVKTILELFATSEEMYTKEKEIVNEEFLAREDTYNLRRGGYGGWDYLNDSSDTHIARTKLGRKNANIVLAKKYGDDYIKIIAEKAGIAASTKEAIAKRQKTKEERGIKSDASHMNTDEVNLKRKKTFADNGHSQGEKNSQFGSMWITNGVENKKIKKTDIIPIGWNKGRKV